MQQLVGRVCVVTGATGTLGQAAAQAWASEGAVVVLVDRHAGRLKAAAEAVRQHGGEVHSVPADITDPDHTERLTEFLEQVGGRVDLLLNNLAEAHRPAFVADASDATVAELGAGLQGVLFLALGLSSLLQVRPGAHVLNTLRSDAREELAILTRTTTTVLSEQLAPVRVNTFVYGRLWSAKHPDGQDPAESVIPRLIELAQTDGAGPTGEEFRP